mmetsp:Transcript_58500/g.148459  ORF Transcript_58500/g.148459 Transcript_58500/m.148459 type:complete len:311 (-) Transcript_58500:1046-1978(-)
MPLARSAASARRALRTERCCPPPRSTWRLSWSWPRTSSVCSQPRPAACSASAPPTWSRAPRRVSSQARTSPSSRASPRHPPQAPGSPGPGSPVSEPTAPLPAQPWPPKATQPMQPPAWPHRPPAQQQQRPSRAEPGIGLPRSARSAPTRPGGPRASTSPRRSSRRRGCCCAWRRTHGQMRCFLPKSRPLPSTVARARAPATASWLALLEKYLPMPRSSSAPACRTTKFWPNRCAHSAVSAGPTPPPKPRATHGRLLTPRCAPRPAVRPTHKTCHPELASVCDDAISASNSSRSSNLKVALRVPIPHELER